MFSEILHRVIIMEVILFILLIINSLLFVFTQSFMSIFCLGLNIILIASGFSYLIISWLYC